MSVLEAPVVTAPPAPGRPTLQARDLVEHLAVVVPLGLWMFPMTRATGGVDGPWAGIVLAALMVSALVLRADTRLGLPAVVLAGLISAGPLVVQATAATGWSGGQDAVGYPLFAVGALVAGSWLRGTTGDAWRARLPFLVAGLGLGLLDQVVRGLLVWYARGVTSTDVRGDFDWRNPFAAYLLPATVLAYYFLVRRSGRAWLLGALVVPFGVAGIILSTSRATQLVIVVALLAVTALALRQSTGRVGVLLRTVVVGAGSLSLVYLLTGPLAPGVAGSALAGDASREAAGETLGGNTGYRISFMKQALGVFGDHPLNGAGFDSLATAAVPHAAPGAPISTYAHGSIPQALSDGGLVLALPLCVALLVLLVRALRTVHAGLVHGRDVPLAVLAVTALGLAAHASVDFDTSRPSCALMGGVMAGAVLVGGPVRLRRPPAAASVALLAVVAVVVGGDVTARQLQVSAPYPHALVEADSVAVAASPWASGIDLRAMLGLLAGDPAAPPALEARAVALSGPIASIDQIAKANRIVLQARLGLATSSELDSLLYQASRRVGLLAWADKAASAAGRVHDAAVLVQGVVDRSTYQSDDDWAAFAAARDLDSGGPWSGCLLGRIRTLPVGDPEPDGVKPLASAADLVGDGCASLAPSS